MNDILLAVLIVAGIGLIAGLGLAVAAIVFAVKKDEKEEAILKILPGANCGACSFAGCADYAKALATGRVKTTLCSVGGAEGVKKISAILGIEAAETRQRVAFVHCAGNLENTNKKVNYQGVKTCFACKSLCGGDGECVYGCTGYGDCAAACPYGAITVKNGVAEVDCSKCKGCGLCVAACPKKLISLVYIDSEAKVRCHNCDRGADTRKVCKIGCIACTKCVKECPSGAITIIDNHAVIDQDKCSGCGKCKEVCPMKAIV